MARRGRGALRSALALAALRCAACCSYDQSVGTGLACAAAPLAATSGNEEDAPGGVVNLGGTGEPSVYAVLSDWGGQAVPPYTTAGQVAASKAMNAVCNVQACKAVLSAGNNFLPAGLPTQAANASTRVDATWQALYGQGPALAVPWYLTGGFRDWEGNVTGERDLSVASTASGVMTWHYPDLWQSLSFVVPPGYSTLQVIMIDTVLLLGQMEPGVTGPPPKKPLAKPATAAVGAMPLPVPGAAATPAAVPLTPAGAALPLSYPAGDAAARRLLDFNALDDPPEISNVQWAWLEVRLS